MVWLDCELISPAVTIVPPEGSSIEVVVLRVRKPGDFVIAS